MPVPAHLTAFWTEFLKVAGVAASARYYEAFQFGDNERLARDLAELVLRGTKRATTAAVWTFEARGKLLPKPGDLSIVTDCAGNPLCVIETEAVDVVAFRDVSAEFAAMEGEGDGSLSSWRETHREYFKRECLRIGRDFNEQMPVACERFNVVFPSSSNAA